MQKALKEASGEDVKTKMRIIGNVFKTKRECSLAEATKRTLSLPMRSSNIDVVYVPTGFQENRIRMLKDQLVLETMDPDDKNVYKTNMLDKYSNRPDCLEEMCYADFATNYTSSKEMQNETENLNNYITAVDTTEDIIDQNTETITLKNELGKMKKRSRPCVMRYHKISKISDPEQYFMILLQLYLPWRNENQIKGEFSTYNLKYQSVATTVQPNIKKHNYSFEQFDINQDDLYFNSESESESESENENVYGLNPELIDQDIEDSNDENPVTVPATVADNLTITNEIFYEVCSNLNLKQQELFNFVAKHAIKSKLAKENDTFKPDPYYIFLSGGAGVGKSYLIKAMTEYLRKILKYPGQNSDKEPSVLVTASTGKAASNIDGITAHSAFSLPQRGEGRVCNLNLGNEKLHKLRLKYRYLQVLLLDEVSMIGETTFNDLDMRLQKILNNDKPFGGISVVLIGDLMQLPPVKQKCIFDGINFTWDLFKLHELVEIVRQNSDPEFAALLNRLRETDDPEDISNEDIETIKLLGDTDTSNWPTRYIKLYMFNHLVERDNFDSLKRLVREENLNIFQIKAKDEARDFQTGSCKITVNENESLSSTGNLPGQLKLCVGARVMLTINIDTEDKLINGSLGTVKILDRVKNGNPTGIVYVKFDDECAGNKLKINRYPKIRGLVPIKPTTVRFPYGKRKAAIEIERMQFPLVLAEAITVHKAQGSGFDYMLADLDQTTKSGKINRAPINPGMVYTLLSRAKCRSHLKLLNFKGRSQIKVNKAALDEIRRMRKDATLSYDHPITKIKGNRICLLNIRSWDLHIEHFCSDKFLVSNSSVLLFTETRTKNCFSINDISQYDENWKAIHHPSEHGLAICYNSTQVFDFKKLESWGQLQILPVLMTIKEERVLIVLLYRPPSEPINVFPQTLMMELSRIRSSVSETDYRTIVAGDFNIPTKNVMLNEVLPPTMFNQRSQYSTHIYGGHLDLVFDSIKSEPVEWVPSPYSDHFVLMFN